MYRTAILTVKALIQLQMDSFAPAAASTTFGELIEMRNNVSRELQCQMELHKLKLAI
jgi:hypothetical protein